MALSEPRSRRLALTPQPEHHQSTCPSLDFSPHALLLLLLLLHKEEGVGEKWPSTMIVMV